jgi:hypothetical protein
MTVSTATLNDGLTRYSVAKTKVGEVLLLSGASKAADNVSRRCHAGCGLAIPWWFGSQADEDNRLRRLSLPIIQQAIWLYFRFTLSFRDVEDLLAERGITVSYETVRRWVNHFGPMIAADLRKRRPKSYTETL